MTTEYFDAANSLCSDSFESIKRSRLISDDYKNSDFDCENQMDYSGDNFQSEVSAKASSSSIHESITNMSNSHSTPEDTFSEITLSSPSSKHCKPDSDIKDYEQSTDQYLLTSNVHIGITQTSNELLKPLPTASNNLKSIDDTIELVLSKIREENNFSKNYDNGESCFKDKSDSSNFVHSNEISNCASSVNLQTNNMISVSRGSSLGTEAHDLGNISYSKGITSSGPCHNSNIGNYGIHNYNNNNNGKSCPQQYYKYNNYGIPPQIAANFPNQINTPNYQEFNKIDYSRSNYPKEYDKNKYNYYPYQCQNPQFRQYLPNSYLNQSFYKPDSQNLPLHNPNYQMLQKSLKRNAYFNQMYIDDDINHLYKDNSKNQNYNTYFKTPQSNTSGLLDQTNSIRKKRTNTDSTKLTPSKKRKVANQFSMANNIDELMRKLKVATYNSLLMNPTVSQSVIVLSPKGFVESTSKSISLKKSLHYKKYRSSLFKIKKPKVFQDCLQEDRYLSRYIDENMTGNCILSSHKKNFEPDDFSDIICGSPSNNNNNSNNNNISNSETNENHLHHLSIDDIDSDPKSPELMNSLTVTRNSQPIKSFGKPPSRSLPVVNSSCLKNHFMTPIVSYTDNETKLITELHSIKSQELNRNYIQLSGSFLKRTKINGKSFSNIHIEEAVSVASLSASKNQNSCHFCYVFLNGLSAIRKNGKSFGIDSNDDLLFCSSSCYSNFKSCNSIDCNSDRKLLISNNNHSNNHSNSNISVNNNLNSSFNSTNNLQCTKVLIKTTPYKPPKNYKKVCDFEQYVRRRFPSEGQGDTGANLPKPNTPATAAAAADGVGAKKRLLGVNYSYFANEPLQTIYKEIEKNDQRILLTKYSCSYRTADDGLTDRRACLLCRSVGDGDESVCGRLMNIDADHWVHLNCALWCFEVYETVSGSLMEVQSSLEKAVKTVCSFCHTTGAGIQCYRSKCACVYHVPCAHQVGCIFYTDRGMYCPNHVVLNHPMHLPSLRVDRRVNIHRDESALVAAIVSEDQDVRIKFRTGSLTLNQVGQLLPEQLVSGHYNSSSIIYPVGYHATRIYWSSTAINKRCKYDCFIDELDDRPLFTVKFANDSGDEQVVTDRCCDKLWKSILHKIAKFRHESGLTRLFPLYLSGEQLYGLTEPQIIRVIESLPGVEMIKNYAFKFGKMQLITEMPLAINPTGAARTEPKLRTYVRRMRDYPESNKSNKCGILKAKAVNNNSNNYSSNNYHGNANNNTSNNSAASVGGNNNHINSANINNTTSNNNNNPIIIYESSSLNNKSALLNSKTQQYKRLKSEWMNNVILSRSKIQGLGLFAAKDFDKSTMIIEYLGEIIRNEVGNVREKLYQARNNSIYMFRLNEDLIIDATVNGGLARYINHSCNPNCVAETLSLDCGTRIIITTRQVIERGEELTYDYKFDFEDNKADRIPCLCGAINCRKWMN